MYIEYLDYPPLPEHLVESIDDIVLRENFDPDWTYANYVTKSMSKELDVWIRATLGFELERQPLYQVLRNIIPIHKDVDGRPFAYNYLLSTGGSNVTTCFYDDDKRLVHSEVIPAGCWHRLRVQHFHSVVQFDKNGVRVSITVTPKFTS